MNFQEFAKTQDVTPASPMVDIFDAAQMYYETKRPILSHTNTVDWWEAAERYAERICGWYAE